MAPLALPPQMDRETAAQRCTPASTHKSRLRRFTAPTEAQPHALHKQARGLILFTPQCTVSSAFKGEPSVIGKTEQRAAELAGNSEARSEARRVPAVEGGLPAASWPALLELRPWAGHTGCGSRLQAAESCAQEPSGKLLSKCREATARSGSPW